MSLLDDYDKKTINELRDRIHDESLAAGWYTKPDAVKQILTDQDPELGEYFEMMREIGYLALIHAEVSEAVEGSRKGLMDSHLPHRNSTEVELADTIIRIFDLCGRRDYDIGGAIVEKLRYNRERQDHKMENRNKKGGKKF